MGMRCIDSLKFLVVAVSGGERTSSSMVIVVVSRVLGGFVMSLVAMRAHRTHEEDCAAYK